MSGGANDNTEGTKVVLPDCFGHYDARDPSCRRCKLKDACKAKQLEMRPECFGVEWDGEEVECQACIISSQCADTMEENVKMARRKVRMRKRADAVEAPKPEPEEEVVEAVAEESDYTEMSVADLRAECEERELEPTGRKSVLVRRLLEDDGEEVEAPPVGEKISKPVPSQASIKRRAKGKKAAPKPEPEPEPEPADEDADFSFDGLLAAMNEGAVLVVACTADGYIVSASSQTHPLLTTVTTATAPVAAAPQTKGLRGDEFWREVLSEDYYEFTKEDAGDGKAWDDMTREEKVEFADDLGVSWEESKDEKVDFMAMVRAVMKHKEITKYKPEYKSSAARKALR